MLGSMSMIANINLYSNLSQSGLTGRPALCLPECMDVSLTG